MANLVAVRITKRDLGQRRATTWVMNNVLHNPTNVSMAFGIVQGSKLGWALSEASVGS